MLLLLQEQGVVLIIT